MKKNKIVAGFVVLSSRNMFYEKVARGKSK